MNEERIYQSSPNNFPKRNSGCYRINQVSIILLLLATGVALLSRRFRIPYVTGLVLAGLPITELLSRPIGLNPTLVLNLFLPILIFEAGINTDVSRLRSTFKPIALLAGPGAVLSSAIIAVLLKFGLGLSWIPALFVGVILANTDTVSMIAVFKEILVLARLSTIGEGETPFSVTIMEFRWLRLRKN